MKKDPLITAGYCGLSCKSCSVYIASELSGEALKRRAEKAGMSAEELRCEGCRSEKTSPYCTECGIKKCIRERKLNFCGDCAEYPCQSLTDFKNSLPHRAEIFESLEFAKTHSIEEWETKMQKDFGCPECGAYVSVYADACHGCKSASKNAFAVRNWEKIKDSPERKLVE